VCGLLPWAFQAAGLNASAVSYVANESLVKKVYFPRAVLPAASVLAALITFLVELGVLSVALLALAGNMVLPWLPVVLVLVTLHAVFVLGLGLVLSVGNARFRDVNHLLAIGLNVWFYATPILYPIALVEDRTMPGLGVPVLDVLRLNPMFHFVEAYRDLLYHLRFPSAGTWLVIVGTAAVSLAVGLVVHRRNEPRLAELL
jgi:lipopolysaccharide transport system permease protein